MKNSPAAAAAGLKIDMAAYIIDAAVCPSMQAAAVAIHKRLRLLCRAFLSHKRAHCGFFDRLKGERVVRPPFCVDSAPAGMRHIRAMRPPRKERSGSSDPIMGKPDATAPVLSATSFVASLWKAAGIEDAHPPPRRGLLRKARCRASPLRAAVRCLRSISRRFDRARKRDAARQVCEKGIFMKTAGAEDAHPPLRRGLLRKARCRASPL